MNLKKKVGYEAASLVDDGDVVGLGTGATAYYFIEKLADRIKKEKIEIWGVPTSYQSFFFAKDAGIPITTLEEHDIDIAVDGADEVDPNLNLIKGRGAAHTMEKIVDEAADEFVVIIENSKLVDKLGGVPVPLEVIPLACRMVKSHVEKLNGTPTLRMAKNKDGPVITDNSNFIIDVRFKAIEDPEYLETKLNTIPGVVENGIFSGIVDRVLVGTPDGVEVLNNPLKKR